MQESFRGIFPGPGETEAQIVEWAKSYAPLVRFDRSEVHFPSDPETFRRKARFRRSRRRSRDLGWNKVLKKWVPGNDQAEAFYGVEWDEITDASLARLPGTEHLQPWASRNLRPFDTNSIHTRAGRTKSKGLFLQRDERPSRDTSGPQPVAGEVSAPIFLDAEYNPLGDSYRILYWFFYELNQFWWIHTHQGDWEHVSFIVNAQALQRKDPPSHVYFAQHNTGKVLPYTSLRPFGNDRRTVFVDKDGHPTNPSADNPGKYGYLWRTWESEMLLIAKQPWRDFPGAWGAVGSSGGFTGPLGPLYKRQKDQVRVTRRQGKLYVRAFKK